MKMVDFPEGKCVLVVSYYKLIRQWTTGLFSVLRCRTFKIISKLQILHKKRRSILFHCHISIVYISCHETPHLQLVILANLQFTVQESRREV